MLAAAGLVGFGLWVVSGITRFDVPGDPDYFVVRQGIAAAMGAAGLVVAALVPVDLWQRYWKLVYCTALGLMIVVFVAAEAVRGSKRWLDLGVIQFQPSELGKVLFVLAIAGYAVGRVGSRSRAGRRSSRCSAWARLRSCSCSCSRTSERRSCTRLRCSPCSSSSVSAGASC